MPVPDEVSDRESFHLAVRSLLTQPTLSKELQAARVEQSEREGFVVHPHARATVYSWGKATLPQKSGGPYISFLLSRGVPVDELEAWVDALERARRAPGPTPDGNGHVQEEPQNGVPPQDELQGPPPHEPPRDRVVDDGPRPADGRPAGRRRWLAVAAVTTIVLLVGVLLVVRHVGSGASAQPGSPLPSSAEEPFLREDFDGTQLATATWSPPSESAHVYAADRRLNLVGATDADRREIDSDLAPRNPQDFREIDFVASIPDSSVPGAGGASLVVTEQDGRTHMMVFGPSPGTPPTRVAAALICSRPSCRSYDDYDPPPPTRPFEYFAGDEVVPMRVVQNDGTLTFFMRGQVMGRTPVSAPLRSFRFNAYSGPDERWRATVDAVRVYR